jgi:hypothetical protein
MRVDRYCRRLGVAGWFLQSVLFTVLLSGFQASLADTGSRTREKGTNSEKVVEGRVKVAKKACSTGDYQKGVELLADLYVETNDPNHVFNQGRCYEQNNRFDEALARFREFQRIEPEMPPEVSKKVLAHIVECEDELAKRAARNVAPAQPTAVPTATTEAQKAEEAPLPISSAPASPALAPAQPVPNHEAGRGLRIAGISAAVAGFALLGAGVAFNLASNSADAQVRDGAANKVSTRDRYETLGWVGYGAGALALATGTTLFIIGYQAGNTESSKLSVVPAFAHGQASLTFGGVF